MHTPSRPSAAGEPEPSTADKQPLAERTRLSSSCAASRRECGHLRNEDMEPVACCCNRQNTTRVCCCNRQSSHRSHLHERARAQQKTEQGGRCDAFRGTAAATHRPDRHSGHTLSGIITTKQAHNTHSTPQLSQLTKGTDRQK